MTGMMRTCGQGCQELVLDFLHKTELENFASNVPGLHFVAVASVPRECPQYKMGQQSKSLLSSSGTFLFRSTESLFKKIRIVQNQEFYLKVLSKVIYRLREKLKLL